MNTGKHLNGTNDARRIATLHRSDGMVAAILAQAHGSTITVHDSATIPEADTTGLKARLESWKPDIVINVLPGGSVISRIIEVPDVPDADAQIDAAILQAEAELPPVLPEHRRSVAMLPWNTTTGPCAGLALGWLGEAPTLPTVGDPPVPVYFTGQAACLAELLIASGADGMIALASQRQGSLELVSKMAQNVAVRTAKVDQDDWSGALSRLMIETALAAGAGDQTIEAVERAADEAARADTTLISDPDIAAPLAARISGSKNDALWWNQFGLCVGAALGAAGPRAANFTLCCDAPAQPQGLLYNAANWLTVPRNASRLLVASIILLLALPFATAWLRYEVLSFKTRKLEEVRKHADEQAATAEFFVILNEQRWPMTKLLADIATMADYDLDIDSIYLDSGSNITLSGDAPLDQGDNVLAFQRNLDTSQVFTDVRQPKFEYGENKIEFEFQIAVQNSLAQAKRPYDEPLGVKMYGQRFEGQKPGNYIFDAFRKGRSSRVQDQPEDEDAGPMIQTADSEPPSSPETFDSGPSGLDFGAAPSNAPARRSTPATPRNPSGRSGRGARIPIGQLTDEIIANMQSAQVTSAMSMRGQIKDRDPVAKEEYDKLLKRFHELRDQQGTTGGGSSPPSGGSN